MEGIFWVGTGLIISILAWRFNLGSFVEPGPGFVALLSGLFLSVVGLIMIFSKAFSKSSPSQGISATESPLEGVPWPRLTYTLGLLLSYTVLFKPLGYVLVTFLFMWGMSYDWKKKNWVSSLLFSLMVVIITYLIFEIWLKCQLPPGIFP